MFHLEAIAEPLLGERKCGAGMLPSSLDAFIGKKGLVLGDSVVHNLVCGFILNTVVHFAVGFAMLCASGS